MSSRDKQLMHTNIDASVAKTLSAREAGSIPAATDKGFNAWLSNKVFTDDGCVCRHHLHANMQEKGKAGARTKHAARR